MNASVDKKTKVMHKNNNKKKKQHTQSKSKHKKKTSPSHHRPTSTTTTSIVIATHQPTVQDAPIVFLSTPIPTATPLTLPDQDDASSSLLNVSDQDEDRGFYQAEETDYTASAAAIHKMEDTESITAHQQQPKSVSTATQVTQVAAPVIGVFGGIALIAAAMFYVVRKRKRNSLLVQDMSSNKRLDFDDADAKSKHYTDGDEMHDISLLDEDEAIMVMGQPPKLTPAAGANATNDTTITMSCHYLSHSAIINVPENHPVNNPSNMTDNSHYSSRANSLHLPPLSYRNSCRSSTTSTVYTDALMSPISSVFDNPHHISSFLMIAERQQLQHQRPSILDHFNNGSSSDIKPSRSSPIETYKAQLTELAVLDNEEEGDDEEGQEPPSDPLLPFSTVIDLTEVY
ncbi:hypothetical protein MAM1_0195d07753 [Mucor ambiguus]|uniref:Uncharacterized protein n=1 Tax=Mucor ambiguus TaxID=91626 RepID=A0A0C9MCB6_9FUNG|nr:hypothetical protein MAM1_0195d07753 [Mucor ambiguus]